MNAVAPVRRRSAPAPRPLLEAVPDLEPPASGAEEEPEEVPHVWIAAAEVPIDNERVRGAMRVSSLRIKEQTAVKVLDVYCQACRRPWEAAAGSSCQPKHDVLRGGPPDGTRRKRSNGATSRDGL